MRRVRCYGWDKAAGYYDAYWRAQLCYVGEKFGV